MPNEISRDVAEFLLGVVYGINLSAGQENFDELLPLVLKSKAELQAIVNTPETPKPNRSTRRAAARKS